MIKQIALRKLASAGSYLDYKNGETDGKMYGGLAGTAIGGVGGGLLGRRFQNKKLRLASTIGGAVLGGLAGKSAGGSVGGGLGWLSGKRNTSNMTKTAGAVGGALLGFALGGPLGAVAGGLIGNHMSKQKQINNSVQEQMQSVSLNTSKAPSNTSTLVVKN